MADQMVNNSSDIIKDSLAGAVNQVVTAMQPQVNEFATRVATRAVDQVGAGAQTALRTVQRQPWYLVGCAAALLVGAALIIGFGSREVIEDSVNR